MQMVLFVVAALLLAKLAAELVLELANRRHVRAHAGEVPEAYRGAIDEETYRKSVNYTLERNALGILETVYDAAILAVVLFSGLLPWLYYALEGLLGASQDRAWAQACVVFGVFIVLSLPALPFELYSQFKVEAKYGFNRASPGLWLSDKLKGLAVAAILGIPALWLLLWFFDTFPQTWWLWGFGAIFVLQLLMLVLFPRLILPLFNKLTPLPGGELRERLLKLAKNLDFTARSIFVIDGSKRSTHSNAFFTGFGRFRRIVLYDTLVDQLEPPQVEAVLAHEIGHYKLGHIPKMLVFSALMMLAGFAVIGWLAGQAGFYEAFGFELADGMGPALILFVLLSGLVTFWISPLMNFWSRRHEYEADAFAKQTVGTPEPLLASLRTLMEKNLGNLTPHPAYSAFHYSHPTLHERESALRGED